MREGLYLRRTNATAGRCSASRASLFYLLQLRIDVCGLWTLGPFRLPRSLRLISLGEARARDVRIARKVVSFEVMLISS